MRYMLVGQRRNITFMTKLFKGKSQNITEEIGQKPTVTGNGPFVEEPHFEPLGDPSRLLNIRLPQSSKVNVRAGSIVSINGNISDISYDVKNLSPNTFYQQLYTESSNSFAISSKSGNYSIIEVENGNEEWTILRNNSLISWTEGLKLKEIDSFSKIRSFRSFGKGKIVVGGESPIYGINLDANEEILINPNALVAINKPFEFEIFNQLTINIPSLSGGYIRSQIFIKRLISRLPKLGLGPTLRSYVDKLLNIKNDGLKSASQLFQNSTSSLQSSKIFLQLKNKLYSFTHHISLIMYNKVLNRKPILFKVKGPAKLLLNNNNMLSNSHIFSKEEINYIFKKNRLK